MYPPPLRFRAQGDPQDVFWGSVEIFSKSRGPYEKKWPFFGAPSPTKTQEKNHRRLRRRRFFSPWDSIFRHFVFFGPGIWLLGPKMHWHEARSLFFLMGCSKHFISSTGIYCKFINSPIWPLDVGNLGLSHNYWRQMTSQIIRDALKTTTTAKTKQFSTSWPNLMNLLPKMCSWETIDWKSCRPS